MAIGEPGRPMEFSIELLFEALDARRIARGLSWAALARELDTRFNGTGGGAISPSTLSGMRSRSTVEGDGVLQVLLWLEQAPETFVPGQLERVSFAMQLPDPASGHILRWDARALHAALEQRRTSRGMAWPRVAAEIGCAPGELTRLANGGRVAFPAVMRIVGWLGEPAANFTRSSPV